MAARDPPAGSDRDRRLTVHGPVEACRRRLVPAGLDRSLLVERWTFPDGSRLLELSTRCDPETVLQTAARTAEVLSRHGVDLTGPQQTKTRATLDFFAARGEVAARAR